MTKLLKMTDVSLKLLAYNLFLYKKQLIVTSRDMNFLGRTNLHVSLQTAGTKINGNPVANGYHFCSRAPETFLLTRPCGD